MNLKWGWWNLLLANGCRFKSCYFISITGWRSLSMAHTLWNYRLSLDKCDILRSKTWSLLIIRSLRIIFFYDNFRLFIIFTQMTSLRLVTSCSISSLLDYILRWCASHLRWYTHLFTFLISGYFSIISLFRSLLWELFTAINLIWSDATHATLSVASSKEFIFSSISWFLTNIVCLSPLYIFKESHKLYL